MSKELAFGSLSVLIKRCSLFFYFFVIVSNLKYNMLFHVQSLSRMNKKDSWLFWWTIYLSVSRKYKIIVVLHSILVILMLILKLINAEFLMLSYFCLIMDLWVNKYLINTKSAFRYIAATCCCLVYLR